MQVERHEIKSERHEIKPAWVVESCMRTGRHKTSVSQDVVFKECAEVSKTKSANRGPNKIEAAIAKLIKRVIPKNKARRKVILKNESTSDKSRSGESAGGCVLAQNLTPKEESTKRPIKIMLGGLVLIPTGKR